MSAHRSRSGLGTTLPLVAVGAGVTWLCLVVASGEDTSLASSVPQGARTEIAAANNRASPPNRREQVGARSETAEPGDRYEPELCKSLGLHDLGKLGPTETAKGRQLLAMVLRENLAALDSTKADTTTGMVRTLTLQRQVLIQQQQLSRFAAGKYWTIDAKFAPPLSTAEVLLITAFRTKVGQRKIAVVVPVPAAEAADIRAIARQKEQINQDAFLERVLEFNRRPLAERQAEVERGKQIRRQMKAIEQDPSLSARERTRRLQRLRRSLPLGGWQIDEASFLAVIPG